MRITVREFLSLTAYKKRSNSGLQEEHETLRFFQGTNTIIVLDDCAALKELKSSTGHLVSLGFSAPHVGITSISKPFCENMATIALFYSPSDKTAKAIQDYARELTSEKKKNLMAKLKKQNFLSGLCLALSLQNQNY